MNSGGFLAAVLRQGLALFRRGDGGHGCFSIMMVPVLWKPQQDGPMEQESEELDAFLPK